MESIVCFVVILCVVVILVVCDYCAIKNKKEIKEPPFPVPVTAYIYFLAKLHYIQIYTVHYTSP